MKLNQRLSAVASLVEENQSIIDVGCDHAFLAIDLVTKKKVKKMVASDNKEGPLAHAKENIKKAHLSDRIEVQLANGIEQLDPSIDTIIISGMGGRNMIGICKYAPRKMQSIKTIILSPNNDCEVVRREFVKMGYYIDRELLVQENKIIYPVLRFKKGRKHYSTKDYLLGPCLRQEKSSLFLSWNERELKQKELLLKMLPKKYWTRKWSLKREIKIRKEIV